MEDPEQIVTAARAWIGTPYVHQASRFQAGADCLGLIRGVWRDLYGREPETPPPYTPDWGETGSEELLLQGAMRHLRPVSRMQPIAAGQVVLFRMRAGAVAKHLGIMVQGGEAPRFVHAYMHHGVVESPLSIPWRNRISARFRFP
ncbi:peptidase [Paracoccus seriniphilus]|uniref:Putative phage cell wall peptidase, NlpC/P60 family n=1 Tax=Paracoccus seriniphilus TaxID=184748 RepID=A0A239PNB6_9RHOB|nr:peptidase [Paracoccus seriniphilus]WCR14784.1 peptidase [Paracoccus seriniphilus]SNT71804.1 putative phage cell wall peptidase, NlpC/P60 family [Paracoccus seriniphilus]